jgi:hypothetical protein
VQIADVAESHERLRIGAHGRHVQTVHDPVRARPAGGRDDRSHARVAQRVIDIREPVLVGAGQEPAPVEGVFAELGPQAPPGEHRHDVFGPVRVGKTGRRHHPDPVTGPQSPPSHPPDSTRPDLHHRPSRH